MMNIIVNRVDQYLYVINIYRSMLRRAQLGHSSLRGLSVRDVQVWFSHRLEEIRGMPL